MTASETLHLDPAVMDEIAARFIDTVVARVIELMRAEGVIVEASGTT